MIVWTTSVCSYLWGFIGGREMQWQRAQGSRENIEEYLQNLLAKQAIIFSEGALREEVVTRS